MSAFAVFRSPVLALVLAVSATAAPAEPGFTTVPPGEMLNPRIDSGEGVYVERSLHDLLMFGGVVTDPRFPDRPLAYRVPMDRVATLSRQGKLSVEGKPITDKLFAAMLDAERAKFAFRCELRVADGVKPERLAVLRQIYQDARQEFYVTYPPVPARTEPAGTLH